MLFLLDNLQIYQKSVSLRCVFHSIRFKVNKGWSTAVLLFLCLYAITIGFRGLLGGYPVRQYSCRVYYKKLPSQVFVQGEFFL